MEEKTIAALDKATSQTIQKSAAFGKLMTQVYLWMTFALVITGLTSGIVATNEQLLAIIFASKATFYGLLIAEFMLVVALTATIEKLSSFTATLLFILYSMCTGATMASIFFVFELSSIGQVFLITAGTFAAMSAIGFITKKDLGSWGKMLLMGLIGIIIATVVNLFMGSGLLDMVISVVGVGIFVGLTVYDTQKIKLMLMQYGTEENEMTQKLALMGSLTLYLDFINLFLKLLSLFGKRK